MRTFYILLILPLLINNQQTKSNFSFIPNDEIYELNDMIFDLYIEKGEKYRWFILFYLRTCGYCRKAKKEIEKIFKNYTNTKTRFAELEIDDNVMSNVRFNISGVPHIILVENNKMLTLEKYPNEKNLIEFLNTSFNDVKDEIVDFPKKITFAYVVWTMFKQQMQELGNYISQLIEKNTGKEVKIKGWHIMFFGFIIIILLCYLEFLLLSKCCDNDNIDKEISELLKQKEKKLEKIDDNIEEEKENYDNLNEEQKNEIEKKKEDELKEKEKNKEKEKEYKSKEDKSKQE